MSNRNTTRALAVLILGALWASVQWSSSRAVPVAIDEPGSGHSGGGAGDTSIPSPTCKTVTVKGNVFYNDQRKFGRFPLRQNRAGTTGVQYAVANGGNRAVRTANYLGLFEGTVEIYEVDLASDAICKSDDLQGTATIAADGSWSWSGDICDICGRDDASETSAAGKIGVSIAAKTVLRHCPDSTGQCYSVRDPGPFRTQAPRFDDHGDAAKPYARWNPAATNYTPRRVYDGKIVTLPDHLYEGSANDPSDIHAQAANVFASLVDVTRTMHRKYLVPFNRQPFGEVRAIFPMNWASGGGGHSHQPGEFCLPAPRSGSNFGQTGRSSDMTPNTWPTDRTVFHEYGHIVMYRAWEGLGKWTNLDYDINSDGVVSSSEGGNFDASEFYGTATKEAWGNFVMRVALNGVTDGSTGTTRETLDEIGCDRSASYDNDVSGAASICTVPLPCKQGHRSPLAVEHALCDWFDNSVDGRDNDGDEFKGGSDAMSGERFSAIYEAMKDAWSLAPEWLRDSYAKADSFENGVKRGVHLCDFAKAHAIANPDEAQALDSTLKHNGIDCDL